MNAAIPNAYAKNPRKPIIIGSKTTARLFHRKAIIW